MTTPKKIASTTRKWQKMAARGSKTIFDSQMASPKAAAIADKGHFVVYAADGKRFVVPLSYLLLPIFQALLSMAEEEFGLSIRGAITLPCDAALVDYVMSLARRDVPKEVENAVLVSLTGCGSSIRCSWTSLAQGNPCQQLPIHGY